MDGAQYRHPLPTYPLQGRRAGRGRAGGGRYSVRRARELLGRPACQERTRPRAGGNQGKRSTLNPEWPTLQQEGVKEVDASNWTALFAPKATPQPVIDKLNAEVVKILHMPDVKGRFAGGGVATIPS